jgi:hypothetical protein
MSIKARLDSITRQPMFAEWWDGHTLEDLAPYFAGEKPAENVPHGLN